MVYGKAGGVPHPLNLATLGNSGEGFRIEAAVANARLGAAVSAAGDVNGDGSDDVIISNGAGNVGMGYVVFGSQTGFAAQVDVAGLNGSNGFKISGTGVNSAYVPWAVPAM